jgi:salicylate hydroxylase
MSSPKVLVIGCGIAGPVVACLLKQKGYEPIIFERSEAPGDVGASLMICPNGLKVLNLIGPLPDRLLQNGPAVLELCDYKAFGEVLGRSDIPTEFAERYGQPAVGVKRTLITSWLREVAIENGIEVREGWKLEQIQETDDSVTAVFEGGKSESGCFLVGCDGLKAATRRLLLARGGIKDGEPSFTGLTQVGTPMGLITALMLNMQTDRRHLTNAQGLAQQTRCQKLVWRAESHHLLPNHSRQDVLGIDIAGRDCGRSRVGPVQ